MPEANYANYKKYSFQKWLTVGLALIVVLLLGTNTLFAYQNYQLRQRFKAQPIPLHENSQEGIGEVASKKWYSPSQKKYITYKYSKDFGEYGLILYNGEKEQNIGRTNEPVNDLEISWSPDETKVVVSYTDDLTRIYCADEKDPQCSGELLFVVYGGSSIYWSDNQTGYFVYRKGPNDVVSKLSFSTTSLYPEEKILYEQKKSAFFAYQPTSVSPNGLYLVMELHYEGPPTLAVMNTQTGKIVRAKSGEELYVLSSVPNYTWDKTELTFRGGLTEKGSWLKFTDEATHEFTEESFENITVDVAQFF